MTSARPAPRITAILPRGEAIRNFVYSGAFDTLATEADVDVLSVIPSEEIRQVLTSRPFRVHPLQPAPERKLVRALRDLLDMAHGRHLWSGAARKRWRLRDCEARTLLQRLKRQARKLLCYPFANACGLEVLSRLERGLSRGLRTESCFLRRFQQNRPALVFNASHVHSAVAIQAVQAAQWLKIPTVTFIFSWDNLTSQGRIIPSYDHYLVWNEDLRRQLLGIYPSVRPEQVVVTGTPQFDFHFRQEFWWTREEFCARVGADPQRPIVLYTTGMPNHMPGEERIVEGVADMVRDLPEFGPPQLLVRVYPKDRTDRFEDLKRRRKDLLFPPVSWEPAFLTPKPEDLHLLTNTLRHCAAGINIASTISLELCMFDKPVINVGYDPPGMDLHALALASFYTYDHYAPVVASGAVEVARSQTELRQMLENALRRPAERSERRRGLVRGMFGETLDGRSACRVAQALLRLATANGHA